MDEGHMYGIKTVAELDEWARRNNISIDTDTELSLRRISLLADQLTVPTHTKDKSPRGNRCAICNKSFKQKSHLLRHERTFHENSTKYTCPDCNTEFNRKDNFDRHMKQH
ncbi:Zinc finger protein zas1 [Mizuhopecten yessoensis]|uniref:Zinc finger protein zas1 n=1 Tax=Mizuhopecten yessoensis TaxID=6573 RepID=A0A210Q8A8_MIZYE|nr:Zinc finger protein zas1 [Mizuhopecten yessoensis]